MNFLQVMFLKVVLCLTVSFIWTVEAISCEHLFDANKFSISNLFFKSERRKFINTYREWWRSGRTPTDRDLATVGERVPDLQPVISNEHTHRFIKMFILGVFPGLTKPVPVTTFRFHIPLNKKSHWIDVVIPKGQGQHRGVSDVDLATYLVKNLPFLTLSATKRIELIPVTSEMLSDSGSNHYVTGLARANTMYILSNTKQLESAQEVKTLIHEHGHHLAYTLYPNTLTPNFWTEVMAHDSNQISERSKNDPMEDFAESFETYFRARNNDHSMIRPYPARFLAIDYLFETHARSFIDYSGLHTQ